MDGKLKKKPKATKTTRSDLYLRKVLVCPHCGYGITGATSRGTLSDTGELVYLGNTDPRYLYGLNLSAQWRGFDISVMFQGVGKRKAMVQFGAIAPLSGTGSMPWTIHRDYWTEDNQDAYWPRLCNYANNDFNFKTSDKWIQNAAYIRLKNVTVGYTLPIPKKYVERVRVYVTGEDIWEHTKMLSAL